MNIEIQKKVKSETKKGIKILKPEDVCEVEEVQEIREAMQEYVLMLGLDNANSLKNVTLVGIGTTNEVTIDMQNILRTALLKGSNQIILVHNHPSNTLIPSMNDKLFSNICGKLAEIFNINLLDHIIVTEDKFVSMKKLGELKSDLEDVRIKFLDEYLKYDDSLKIKKEIKELKKKIAIYEMEDNEME